MDFLFFDIECATCSGGGKLCEFGYVLADENYCVKERGGFLINPRCKFDDYVINKMLHHTLSEYESSPEFPAFYDKITSLLTNENSVIVGHTVRGDVEHVGDDCVRYGLRFPDMEYVDIVELFKIRSGKNDATALVKMCDELGIEQTDGAHSAECDAEMTLLVLKALSKETGKSFEELRAARPSATGRTVGYEQTVLRRKTVDRYYEELKTDGVKLAGKNEMKNLTAYGCIIPETVKKIKRIKGKRIAISGLLETAQYRKVVNMVRLLKRGGARYTPSVKNCNIFVEYCVRLKNGEEVYCRKKEEVQKLIAKGKKIEIITAEELCAILCATEKDLAAPVKFIYEKAGIAS